MGDTQPPDPQINGGPLVVSSETVGSKRQRRPSVRLGDIGGDQPPYDSYSRRTNKDKDKDKDKPWKLSFDHPRDSSAPPKNSSKTRPLINLTSSEDKENNLDSLAIGSWRLKDSKRRPPPPTKRLRSNWVSSKNDQGSAAEDVDDAFRDYDMDNSTSPLKEQSPLNSTDNLAIQPRSIRSRDREEFSVPSDTDGGNWKCGDTNGTGCEDGVKVWLNGLGLGRYAPVFEIHEVDDEVLPMLTLEDLKDMGINAVGSRRKMFSAILKLGKGFS